MSALNLDETFADREPQAKTYGLTRCDRGAVERLENSVDFVHSNSRAAVQYCGLHVISGSPKSDFNRFFCWRVLLGIAEEVDEDLLRVLRVSCDEDLCLLGG